MKRKKAQEHDEAIARAQADDRREHLLAELRAHQGSAGTTPAPSEPPSETREPDAEPSPSVSESSAAPEPDADPVPPDDKGE